jgi:hypothetical protein
VIDTGAFEVDAVMEAAQETARMLEMSLMSVEGNLSWIEDLLKGNWTPDRFLIIPPGGSVTFEDSLAAGRSRILEVPSP